MDISGMTDIPAKSILIFWFKRWNLWVMCSQLSAKSWWLMGQNNQDSFWQLILHAHFLISWNVHKNLFSQKRTSLKRWHRMSLLFVVQIEILEMSHHFKLLGFWKDCISFSFQKRISNCASALWPNMGVNEFSSDLPIRFDVTSQTAARLHSSRKPKDTLARGVIKREKWLFKNTKAHWKFTKMQSGQSISSFKKWIT